MLVYLHSLSKFPSTIFSFYHVHSLLLQVLVGLLVPHLDEPFLLVPLFLLSQLHYSLPLASSRTKPP